MKALVVGGGVVAVTCAYFLARAGSEVTLIEEKDALGLEATSGNAGIIAPGHAFAWGSPRGRGCSCAPCAGRDGDPVVSRPTLTLHWCPFLRE